MLRLIHFWTVNYNFRVNSLCVLLYLVQTCNTIKVKVTSKVATPLLINQICNVNYNFRVIS